MLRGFLHLMAAALVEDADILFENLLFQPVAVSEDAVFLPWLAGIERMVWTVAIIGAVMAMAFIA